MKLPRVLIAIITYEGKDYCYEEFKKHAKGINYPNKKFLLIDNSADNSYAKKLRKDWDTVFRTRRGNNARESLARSQEYAKRFMQKNNYDYLLFLESDMMVPPDVVQRLMKHGKPMVGVYYEIGYENDRVPCITLFVKDKQGFFGTRKLQPDEFSNYKNNGLLPVAHCGLGCTLIHKDVFDGITFKYFPELKGYSDVFFANDVAIKGTQIFCDTNIVVPHDSFNSCHVKDR